MDETNLPRWSARLDVARPPAEPGFTDIASFLPHHYRLHQQAVDFLGPYNAKQRAVINGTYVAPSKDQLKQVIKQGGVNDFTYQAFIGALERFCYQTRGKRALPTPHPSVIHSIQLPLPAFELQQVKGGTTIINVIGIKVPLLVKEVKNPSDFKFLILRPKLSKLGTPSIRNWEALFFKNSLGYIPEWVDTNLNPRWSGIL
jgi:hypothetical protein